MIENLELIIKSKTDNNALEKLLKDYEPMIYSLAKSFNVDGYTIDDLMQEARFAFCQAVKKFDETKGGKLSTFSYLFVKRRLKDIKKAEQVLKRRAEVVTINTGDEDNITYDIPSTRPNPEERVIMNEERQEVGDALRGKLTQLEFDVAILFSKGYSYVDIAKLMNVSKKQVDNALQRVRKKLKE